MKYRPGVSTVKSPPEYAISDCVSIASGQVIFTPLALSVGPLEFSRSTHGCTRPYASICPEPHTWNAGRDVPGITAADSIHPGAGPDVSNPDVAGGLSPTSCNSCSVSNSCPGGLSVLNCEVRALPVPI